AITSPSPIAAAGTGRRIPRRTTRCTAIVGEFADPGPAPAAAPWRAPGTSFAHPYETGGIRRVYLRGHTNIRKRVLIHAGGFNLGLLMRQLIGGGTPRGLQGRLAAA